MQLLLVDADLNFRRVLESVLSHGGIRVEGLSDPTLAWGAFNKRPADLVLVDMPPEFEAVEQFLGKLRQDVHGAQVPVVLMSEKHHPDSKAVAALLKKHQLQQFLARPFEMFGIAGELKKVAKQGGPSPAERPAPARPHKRGKVQIPTAKNTLPTGTDRAGFRLLKDIWLHNRTGVLRREPEDNWVLICKGGLQNKADEFFVEAGLRQGGLTFQQTHQDCTGDALALGRLLWEHAQDTISVSFEVQLDKKALQLSSLSERADDLALSHATRQVLQAANPQLSVGEQLRKLKLQPQDVSRQLGALKALGLIDLTKVADSTPPKGTESDAPRAMAPAIPNPRAKLVPRRPPADTPATPEAILARLNGEYQRLKNADDFTILGIPKGADDEFVRATWERLKKRYTTLANDNSMPKALQHRAEVLLRLSKEAAKRVLTNREVMDALDAATPTQKSQRQAPQGAPSDQSIEDMAYYEGSKAFSAGDHKRAVQCFRKARDERIDSVRNMAWLGWAVFHDKEKPEEERNEEALDLLHLASSFDPGHRQGQFFLAFVELKTEQAEQAVKRLRVLLKRYPDHAEAKNLLLKLGVKKNK